MNPPPMKVCEVLVVVSDSESIRSPPHLTRYFQTLNQRLFFTRSAPDNFSPGPGRNRSAATREKLLLHAGFCSITSIFLPVYLSAPRARRRLPRGVKKEPDGGSGLHYAGLFLCCLSTPLRTSYCVLPPVDAHMHTHNL